MPKLTPEERAQNKRSDQGKKAQKAIDDAIDDIAKLTKEIGETTERIAKDKGQAKSFGDFAEENTRKLKGLKRDLKRAEKREKSKRGMMAKMLQRHSQKIRRG